MANADVSVIPTLPSRNSANDNVVTDVHPTAVQSEVPSLAQDADALPSDSNPRNHLAEDGKLPTATFSPPNDADSDAVTCENLPNEQCASETSTNKSVLRNNGNATAENHSSNESGLPEEKIHFDLGEKFEGKDLVRWLISADQDSSDERTMTLDAKQLCSKICARLVNMGVLVPAANTRSSKKLGFTPDLSYQWAREGQESTKTELSEIDGPPPTNSVPQTNSIPPPPPPTGGIPSIAMRKKKIRPLEPMTALHWTRILIPVGNAKGGESQSQNSVWSQIEEDKSVDIERFTGLFSSKRIQRKEGEATKIQRINVLDIKRAKAVGIFEKSLRFNFEQIKTAIYDLDTSVVDLEMMKRIYDIRPTEEELEGISAFVQKYPDVPLGDPENFVKQLSSIPQLTERITCLLFQSKFADAIIIVSSKLTNLRSTCKYLRDSVELKKVIAIILTLGNYMNGENSKRGQADGFHLEILGNLKDVKSHSPGTTLLHFIVRTSRTQQETQQSSGNPPSLPIPEPDKIGEAATIKFKDLRKELKELGAELDDCIAKYKVATASDSENSDPFKSKMEAFANNAVLELSKAKKELEDSVREFKATMQFYQCIPQGLDLDSAEPRDFFHLWKDFCNDFKDIWTKEQECLTEQRLRENRKKRKVKKESRRHRKT